MNYLKKSCAAVFVAAVWAVLAVSAHQEQGQQEQGMVSVDLHEIRADIAKNMNLNASQIPLTVEVSTDVAATACDMSVSDLKDQAKSGEPKCTAKKNSQALERIVKSELKKEGTVMPPKK
jgi:redox-regulated HSP33 family molecular chaperone